MHSSSGSALALGQLSLFLLTHDQFALARDVFECLQKLDPSESSLWLAQAYFNRNVRTPDACAAARAAFARSIELGGSSAAAHAGAGEVGVAAAVATSVSLVETVFHLSKAVEMQPLCAATCNLLGLAFEQTHQYQRAESAYSRALALIDLMNVGSRPDDCGASFTRLVRINLARCLCRGGQHAAGLELFEMIGGYSCAALAAESSLAVLPSGLPLLPPHAHHVSASRNGAGFHAALISVDALAALHWRVIAHSLYLSNRSSLAVRACIRALQCTSREFEDAPIRRLVQLKQERVAILINIAQLQLASGDLDNSFQVLRFASDEAPADVRVPSVKLAIELASGDRSASRAALADLRRTSRACISVSAVGIGADGIEKSGGGDELSVAECCFADAHVALALDLDVARAKRALARAIFSDPSEASRWATLASFIVAHVPTARALPLMFLRPGVSLESDSLIVECQLHCGTAHPAAAAKLCFRDPTLVASWRLLARSVWQCEQTDSTGGSLMTSCIAAVVSQFEFVGVDRVAEIADSIQAACADSDAGALAALPETHCDAPTLAHLARARARLVSARQPERAATLLMQALAALPQSRASWIELSEFHFANDETAAALAVLATCDAFISKSYAADYAHLALFQARLASSVRRSKLFQGAIDMANRAAGQMSFGALALLSVSHRRTKQFSHSVDAAQHCLALIAVRRRARRSGAINALVDASLAFCESIALQSLGVASLSSKLCDPIEAEECLRRSWAAAPLASTAHLLSVVTHARSPTESRRWASKASFMSPMCNTK